MSFTTGHDLPSEVIQRVVTLAPEVHRLEHRTFAVTGKDGLANCASTCRHWARLIRPFLFGQLLLTTAEDVESLHAFFAAGVIVGLVAFKVRQASNSFLSDSRDFG